LQRTPNWEAYLKKGLAGFEKLDTFLKDQPWAAGDFMSIADFALVSTVSVSQVNNFK
jgi:glutathione S-transferase